MSIYVDKVHLYCDQCEIDIVIESEELGSKDLGVVGETSSIASAVSDPAFYLGWYIHPINHMVSCPSCDGGYTNLD